MANRSYRIYETYRDVTVGKKLSNRSGFITQSNGIDGGILSNYDADLSN